MKQIEIGDLPSYIGKRVCVSRGDALNPITHNVNGVLVRVTPDTVGLETGRGISIYPLKEEGKLTRIYSLD